MALAPEKIGELVTAGLIFGAPIIKAIGEYFSGRAKKEEKEKPEEDELNLDNMEVISKDDFRELVTTIDKARASIDRGRDCFEDTLACMSIISTLINIIRVNPRMFSMAQDQVFTFLRHADFPSKLMVTAAFELTVKGDYEDATLDTRSDNPISNERRNVDRGNWPSTAWAENVETDSE